MKLNPYHILYKLGIGGSFCFWDKEVSFFIGVTKKYNYKQIDTFDYVKIKNFWLPKIPWINKNVSYKLEGKSEINTTKDEHLEIFPKKSLRKKKRKIIQTESLLYFLLIMFLLEFNIASFIVSLLFREPRNTFF